MSNEIFCSAPIEQSSGGVEILERLEPQRIAQPVQDKHTIAARQNALQVGSVDLDTGKVRAGGDVLHPPRKSLDLVHGRDSTSIRYPAGPGDADQVGARGRVAHLPTG